MLDIDRVLSLQSRGYETLRMSGEFYILDPITNYVNKI